jgi:hypothetical protein
MVGFSAQTENANSAAQLGGGQQMLLGNLPPPVSAPVNGRSGENGAI